jgi:endonuclease YncB( thermonuclease family)
MLVLRARTLTFAVVATLPLCAAAHAGGIDDLGCHRDRKRGDYHCHTGELGGRVYAWRADAQLAPDAPTAHLPIRWRTVTRVIDGDTIVLDHGEKVRLIGVDTPETKHAQKPVEFFGHEATAFTRNLVERKSVRLEYDWQRRDKYGRTLGYVYLEGGTFVNAEIVKQGYGFAYTKYPFRYLEQFRALQREAREALRGLWVGVDEARLSH